MRSRCGVLCSWMMANTQWWLVMTSPSGEMNPPEQPPTLTAPASSPSPAWGPRASGLGSLEALGLQPRRVELQDLRGVHLPSPAATGCAHSAGASARNNQVARFVVIGTFAIRSLTRS